MGSLPGSPRSSRLATLKSVPNGRRGLAAGLLVVASVLSIATVEVRVWKTGDPYYRFLIWNLVLAWVPLVLASAAYSSAVRSRRKLVVPLSIAWILFFPNAPYVLTDFIHLNGEHAAAPVWYDALMISSCAWTALLIGLASLYLMQMVAQRALGTAWSWAGVVAALALASFGVYLGRFVRFNSWDALIRPRRVANVITHQLENPFQHPRMLAVLVLLTASLTVAYAILYVFAGLQLDLPKNVSRQE
jgi:uncharacterized membrane protein